MTSSSADAINCLSRSNSPRVETLDTVLVETDTVPLQHCRRHSSNCGHKDACLRFDAFLVKVFGTRKVDSHYTVFRKTLCVNNNQIINRQTTYL